MAGLNRLKGLNIDWIIGKNEYLGSFIETNCCLIENILLGIGFS
jgi:hypothetical protein